MLFCYSEPKQIPIDESTKRSINWINVSLWDSSDFFHLRLVRRLQKEFKQCNNHLIVTLNPEDVEQIIKLCGEGSISDDSSFGSVVQGLFNCLQKSTVIDLRIATWEQIQTLGYIPNYRWRDKHDSNAEPWPTVKLLMGCRLIMWDGSEIQASWGDYIVQTPKGFGKVSYFAHETQWNVETVR